MGSDASEVGAPTTQVLSTARTFVRGWQTRQRPQREQLLRATATQELADQLIITDPARIPTAKPAQLTATGTSAYSAEFIQRFVDGTAIVIVLAADPQSATGWLVSDVQPWGG